MSEPFLAEIRLMSFNFPPKGWAQCNGQILPINQNQALFSLLGTNYGGNGRTTFALPDLRGRTPIHIDATRFQGVTGGAASHTVIQSELPAHAHGLFGLASDATSRTPVGNAVAYGREEFAAAGVAPDVAAEPSAVGTAGSSQPHSNMQPYLALNFCIALQGIFPSQS